VRSPGDPPAVLKQTCSKESWARSRDQVRRLPLIDGLLLVTEFPRHTDQSANTDAVTIDAVTIDAVTQT
jgi:hypothetical protein